MFSSLVFGVFAQASALLLAAVFTAAGLSKLNPENADYYLEAINNYDITPASWSARLVGLIGALELGIAALIILPQTQFLSLVVGIMLLSVYAYAFIKIIREGKSNIDCGCAGPGGKVKVGNGLVVRNVILIVLAIVATFTSLPLALLAWPLIVLTALVLGLIYLSSEQLMANKQKIRALRESGL